MTESHENMSNTNEHFIEDHCKYCNKVKVPMTDITTGLTTNCVGNEQDNQGIDHRIVLFGWRLRLASGNSHN